MLEFLFRISGFKANSHKLNFTASNLNLYYQGIIMEKLRLEIYLPPLMAKLKAFSTMFTEEDIKGILAESYADTSDEIDFEAFLRIIHYVYMLQYNLIGTKRRICHPDGKKE